MVKLKRLKINQYRNVRPGTELRFDDGVNLVLGKNGAGKTTLLALLSCVAGNDFSALESEAFELEYETSGGDFTARVHINSSPRETPTDVQESSSRETLHASMTPVYRYEVVISTTSSSDTCAIRATQDGTTIRSGSENRQLSPSPPFQSGFFVGLLNQLDDASPFLPAVRDLEVPLAARFDESLDTFLAMTGRPSVTASASSPPTTHLTVTRRPPDGAVYTRLHEFAPTEVAALVPVAHELPGGEVRVSVDGLTSPPDDARTLKFLINAAAVMGFNAAALKPEFKAVRRLGATDLQLFDVQGFSFNFTGPDGTTIHHDLLSYGQKRLLAFYYYLASTEHVVIADELVNGLHHRWIEACMTAIGDRQAFLTSQNPLLFEYVPFESVEQVEAAFITCKTKIVDGAEQLVWQNMPREDAISFFESYKADIESVGDILITRGLW